MCFAIPGSLSYRKYRLLLYELSTAFYFLHFSSAYKMCHHKNLAGQWDK